MSKNIGGVQDESELYYTFQVVNNNNIIEFDVSGNEIDTKRTIPIEFQETRTNPYINCAEDYYMSVMSFEVDTPSIPVFICDAVPNANFAEATKYVITIVRTDDNTVYQSPVSWFPQDGNASKPDVVPVDYYNNPYYYAYTYDWFLLVLNVTFANLSTSAGISSPFFTIENNRIKLQIADVGFNIYFNNELYNLFSSLPAIKILDQPAGTDGQANYLLFFTISPSFSNVIPVYSSYDYPLTISFYALCIYCEFSPLPFWNPIESIVFTVQQMPVVPELISKPVAYGQNNLENTGTNADTYYMLTDYSASLKTGTEYKPNITYEPTSEFRLVELYGEQPLSSLKINLFWKDKFDTLHPLLLRAGGTASLKILFKKKSFYINSD